MTLLIWIGIVFCITQSAMFSGLNLAFFSISKGGEGERSGVLVEYDETTTIFTQPKDKRTEDYVTGRFG